MVSDEDWEEYRLWLLHPEQGYMGVLRLDEDRYAAIYEGIACGQIIIGKIGDKVSWEQRYDFDDLMSAVHGLANWFTGDFEGDPPGWLRHIPSNRRRVNGDPAKEFIGP